MSKEEITTTENVINKENIIVLSKEYDFEGEKFKEIDMSGLENIKARDMVHASRALTITGNTSLNQEMQLEYAIVIASYATGKPVEFFYGLPPVDVLQVRNKVRRFFNGMD